MIIIHKVSVFCKEKSSILTKDTLRKVLGSNSGLHCGNQEGSIQASGKKTKCLAMDGNKIQKKLKYTAELSYNNYIKVKAILSTMMGFSLPDYFIKMLQNIDISSKCSKY